MIRFFGHQRPQARRWVALGAAYLLVLQAIISGISAGAATATAGAAVPAICSSAHATTGPGGSGPQPDRSHHPPCCVLGCNLSGPSAATPPGVASLPAPRATVGVAALPVRRDPVDLRREHRRPSPRGPPRDA